MLELRTLRLKRGSVEYNKLDVLRRAGNSLEASVERRDLEQMGNRWVLRSKRTGRLAHLVWAADVSFLARRLEDRSGKGRAPAGRIERIVMEQGGARGGRRGRPLRTGRGRRRALRRCKALQHVPALQGGRRGPGQPRESSQALGSASAAPGPAPARPLLGGCLGPQRCLPSPDDRWFGAGKSWGRWGGGGRRPTGSWAAGPTGRRKSPASCRPGQARPVG